MEACSSPTMPQSGSKRFRTAPKRLSWGNGNSGCTCGSCWLRQRRSGSYTGRNRRRAPVTGQGRGEERSFQEVQQHAVRGGVQSVWTGLLLTGQRALLFLKSTSGFSFNAFSVVSASFPFVLPLPVSCWDGGDGEVWTHSSFWAASQ